MKLGLLVLKVLLAPLVLPAPRDLPVLQALLALKVLSAKLVLLVPLVLPVLKVLLV